MSLASVSLAFFLLGTPGSEVSAPEAPPIAEWDREKHHWHLRQQLKVRRMRSGVLAARVFVRIPNIGAPGHREERVGTYGLGPARGKRAVDVDLSYGFNGKGLVPGRELVVEVLHGESPDGPLSDKPLGGRFVFALGAIPSDGAPIGSVESFAGVFTGITCAAVFDKASADEEKEKVLLTCMKYAPFRENLAFLIARRCSMLLGSDAVRKRMSGVVFLTVMDNAGKNQDFTQSLCNSFVALLDGGAQGRLADQCVLAYEPSEEPPPTLSFGDCSE